MTVFDECLCSLGRALGVARSVETHTSPELERLRAGLGGTT